jgi:acetyltransferase-like isoleucine patch superfamily enzyme
MLEQFLRRFKIWLYSWLIKRNKNIRCTGKVIIKNWPIIDVRRGGTLELGDGVTLNSENKYYHVQLYGPVKLQARNAGAKLYIGAQTKIHGSCIHATESIRIGENCLIAGNCQIFDCSGHDIFDIYENRPVSLKCKPIVIGDNVWVGANSIILPGTLIKKGTVVAAGSVVSGQFHEYSLIGGNPAVVIKDLQH